MVFCPHLSVVLSKGQVNTRHYRFLTNSGGFVWAETQATILYSSKTSQPEAVVCLNFILRYFKTARSNHMTREDVVDKKKKKSSSSSSAAVLWSSRT